MLVVPRDLQLVVLPARVELASNAEPVPSRGVVSIGHRVTQVAHEQLEARSLPSAVESDVVESLGECLLDDGSECAEGDNLLKSVVLVSIEVLAEGSAVLSGALESKDEEGLESLGVAVGHVEVLSVVLYIERDVPVLVGDVVGTDQVLVVEVVLQQRTVQAVHLPDYI